MKKLAMVMAGLLLTAPAWGAQNAATGEQNEGISRRGELVYKVVKKWGVHVQEAYKADVHAWARQMGPLFAKASLADLQKASDARSFTAMNDALLGQAAAAPTLIGSIDYDLTYVPVTPCRVFDTRLAGGAIATNTVRSFDISAVGDYAFQGGASGNCGGVGAAGSFAAAVINFTVVTPTAAGYITAFPFLAAQPLAATVNYETGDIKGNEVIVKLDQGGSANELSVYTFAQTHLVGDIVGYFIQPEATPLDCVDLAGTATPIAANSFTSASSPACAAGYTQVSLNCDTSNFLTTLSGQRASSRLCFFNNPTASAQTITATTRCCRTPGR